MTTSHTRPAADPTAERTAMADALIENPILNSPFLEPRRHFKFNDSGITNEVAEGRRTSSYFIPIARPKKKGKLGLKAIYDLSATPFFLRGSG